MRILILSIAIAAAAIWVAWESMWRRKEREMDETRQKADAVLAQLARGEPLAPDVELLFPAEHFGTGALVTPVERERFLRLLRAGPYRYPSFGSSSAPRGSWARSGFFAPQVSEQSYIMTGGRAFTLFARRHMQVWQVAIFM